MFWIVRQAPVLLPVQRLQPVLLLLLLLLPAVLRWLRPQEVLWTAVLLP
jgi:hypothetical protein